MRTISIQIKVEPDNDEQCGMDLDEVAEAALVAAIEAISSEGWEVRYTDVEVKL